MPRITEYNEVTSSQGTTALADADVAVVDGSNGVRKITAKKLAEATFDKFPINAASLPVGKSGLYRGALLGSGTTFTGASTPAQRAAIADGSFKGLFIGDYWLINNRVYRIADFNYWKRTGDTDFNVNHIVIVPDASFGNGKMNNSNTTTGAYVGSVMNTDPESVLNQARATISSEFGSYLTNHRIYLPNATANGAESAGAWLDSTVELMNEWMVYGHAVRKAKTDGTYFYTTEKQQLALFKLNRALINPSRYTWWLRDVVSAAGFADVTGHGRADAGGASNSNGVRPAFAVKGTA